MPPASNASEGVLLVCRHEDDCRRMGEPGEHAGQFEPIEPGHGDVEEHDVVVLVVHVVQRVGGAPGCSHGTDECRVLEEEGQLVQCRALRRRPPVRTVRSSRSHTQHETSVCAW